MKSKIFGLVALSVFALVFLFGSVSAVIDYESTGSVTSRTISEGTTSTTFLVNISAASAEQTVNNWVVQSFNSNNSGLSLGDISFSFPSDTTIPSGESNLFTLTLNNIDSDFVGETTFTINITANTSSTTNYETVDLTLTVTPSTEITETQICTFDNTEDSYNSYSELDVNVKGLDTLNGFGDDEKIVVFDEIEVEVEVDNTNGEDIDDISLEWAIVKSDIGTALDDDDFLKEFDEIDEFNLKDGDDEKFTFTFKVNEDDLDMDIEDFLGNDYELVVRATGEIDDDNNTETCGADIYDKELTISGDEMLIFSNFVVDNVKVGEDNFYPQSLTCGTKLQVTADLWSIGHDQGDISVRVYNKDLKIDSFVEIGDIDESESEPFSFEVSIPEAIENKVYPIEFTVYEDNEIFENEYFDDDEDAVFNVLLEVTECVTAKASVSASLESEAKAGQELVIKTIITNPGNKESTYTLNAAGYSLWASSAIVEPQTLTLAAGESEEVLVTIKTLKTAEGSNKFNLEILSENDLIVSQEIQVPIKKSFVAGALEDNAGTTILAVAIIALILAILSVFLVRALRK